MTKCAIINLQLAVLCRQAADRQVSDGLGGICST